MVVKLNKQQRQKWRFWGGVAGFISGAWMIFYLKDNLGFLPAILGTLLLLWER